MPKILMIDVDGVICEHIDNEDWEKMTCAQPFYYAIERINEWYVEGHFICLFTARTDAHRDVTEAWLKAHGVKYHQIIFNKPRCRGWDGYYYIDDRPVEASTFRGAVVGDSLSRRCVM